MKQSVHADTRARLKTVPLFSGLEDNELEALYALSKTRRYPKENIIFLQDDPGDAFYLILSGEVKVTLLGGDGREYILSLLKKGDFFGEMSLFDNAPRSASVVTTEDADFLIIQRQAFLNHITHVPTLLTKFLSTFSQRLRRTDERLGDLALLNVQARVAKTLITLAEASDGLTRGEAWRISKRLTHQDIASMVGATRETITRILNDFKQQGHIVAEGKALIVRKSLKRHLEVLSGSFY